MLGKFKSANEERVTSYYFRTMCRSDMASLPSDEQITTEDCEDPIPEKGMASVMSEFMYIQRSLLLKYEDDSSRAEVFNDDDFYRYGIGVDI
ncbi:MAG: hypothetical protein P4M11_04035 [Candidatus Pacebacteria bacterium]|nr:hypothetical protein [Candidatus Paceibacterota bacterium]